MAVISQLSSGKIAASVCGGYSEKTVGLILKSKNI